MATSSSTLRNSSKDDVITTESVLRVSVSLARQSLGNAAQNLNDEEGGDDLLLASGMIKPPVTDVVDLAEFEMFVDLATQFVADQYQRWQGKSRHCANTNTLAVELLKGTSGVSAFVQAIENPGDQIIVQDEEDLHRLRIAHKLVDYLYDRGLWFWLLPVTNSLYRHPDHTPHLSQVADWATDRDEFVVRCIDLMIPMTELNPHRTSAALATYVVKGLQLREDECQFFERTTTKLDAVRELTNLKEG